jgi:hypothetical protein
MESVGVGRLCDPPTGDPHITLGPANEAQVAEPAQSIPNCSTVATNGFGELPVRGGMAPPSGEHEGHSHVTVGWTGAMWQRFAQLERFVSTLDGRGHGSGVPRLSRGRPGGPTRRGFPSQDGACVFSRRLRCWELRVHQIAASAVGGHLRVAFGVSGLRRSFRLRAHHGRNRPSQMFRSHVHPHWGFQSLLVHAMNKA